MNERGDTDELSVLSAQFSTNLKLKQLSLSIKTKRNYFLAHPHYLIFNVYVPEFPNLKNMNDSISNLIMWL